MGECCLMSVVRLCASTEIAHRSEVTFAARWDRGLAWRWWRPGPGVEARELRRHRRLQVVVGDCWLRGEDDQWSGDAGLDWGDESQPERRCVRSSGGKSGPRGRQRRRVRPTASGCRRRDKGEDRVEHCASD